MSRTQSLMQHLRRNQLYMGMALASIGASYQIVNAMNWGWWTPQEPINLDLLTPQQSFAFDLGFLAVPLFIASFLVMIIGIALWVTENGEHTETK